MADQILHYKASIYMSWIYNNSETVLPAEAIKNITTDYEFDSLNMPILLVNLNIKNSIYKQMIAYKDSAKFLLKISMYNCLEQNYAYDDVVKQQFNYKMTDDYNYSDSISESEEANTGSSSEAYVSTTVGLYLADIMASNKKELGGKPIYGINKGTMILEALKDIPKLCIEGLDTNEDFDAIMIQKQTTIVSYLEYINEKIKKIYSTGYRFFWDFEICYLLSESGKYVPNGKSGPKTVILNIVQSIQDTSKNTGIVLDSSSNSYILYIDASSSTVSANKEASKIVNNVTMVDENGKTSSATVNDNTSSNTSTTSTDTQSTNTQYVRSGQTDNDYMQGSFASNLQTSVNKGNVQLQFTRVQLDESIFTPNMEYRISNYPGNSDYNGSYILVSKKTVYKIQDGDFIPSSTLIFRKVADKNNS